MFLRAAHPYNNIRFAIQQSLKATKTHVMYINIITLQSKKI